MIDQYKVVKCPCVKEKDMTNKKLHKKSKFKDK